MTWWLAISMYQSGQAIQCVHTQLCCCW
uniref:Uncharacterized protein n=1 Tax=Anguilla anguilla TaxID=7936 RepID=A0A0E9QK69_ANGAN